MKSVVAMIALFLNFTVATLAVAGLPDEGKGDGQPPVANLPAELPENLPAIKCELAPEADQGAIESVIFSHDGKTLIAGNMNGVLQWFDLASSRQILSRRVLRQYVGGIKALAPSPNGEILAVLTNLGQVSLINTVTGSTRLALEKFPDDHVYPNVLTFAPDGKLVAGGLTSGQVMLWDTATGRRHALLPAHIIPEHMVGPAFNRFLTPAFPAPINSLAFTSDSRSLITDCGIIRIWNVSTGKEAGHLNGPERKRDCRTILSPDGNQLVLGDTISDVTRPGSSVRIELWNYSPERKLLQLPFSAQSVLADLKFLPDGKTFVTLEEKAIIRLWDAATGKQRDAIRFSRHNHLTTLAISPDGERIAAGGYGSDPIFGKIQLLETDGTTLRPWKPTP